MEITTRTVYKDKYGSDIHLGDYVLLDGLLFEVVINIFNGSIVIDGQTGQERLHRVHDRCENIMLVEREEALGIIETRKPLGLFFQQEDGLIIAIDNRTGEAWVEEFDSFREFVDWLIKDKEV